MASSFSPFISSSLLAIPNKLKSLHLSQDIPLETSPTHSSFFLKARPLHVAGLSHFGAQSFLLSKSWTSATVNSLEKHYMWKAIRKTAREVEKIRMFEDFPGGPVAQTPCSQCRRLRFNPSSGNWIPQVTTKKSHAAAKDPVHCNWEKKDSCFTLDNISN